MQGLPQDSSNPSICRQPWNWRMPRVILHWTSLDFAVLVARSQSELEVGFVWLARRLALDGMLRVAWPKKASRVPTDLTDNRMREHGQSTGLVDVKVCAIDETWSGLKFVIRVKDRQMSG